MKPSEKIRRLFFNYIRTVFILVGHDIFGEKTFKPYWLTYTMYGCHVLLYIGAFKTIYFYDIAEKCNIIAFIGLALQMKMKMYSFKHADVMIALVGKEIEIFEANSKDVTSKRTVLAQHFATIIEWIFKGGFAIYLLAGMFYLLNPLYSYFCLNKIVPILPVYMPYVDENTTKGFAGLIVMHLVFVVLTTVSTAAVDFMYIVLIFNTICFAKIFSINVDELNDMLREEKLDVVATKAKLINILRIHQEIFDMIDMLDTLFFKICFVQIGTAAISAALEFFVSLKIELFPAIALAFSSIFQIINFCAVGTIIEICNDEIHDSIILGDWYLLPLPDQKIYMHLMLHAQNAMESKTLTIGDIAPLNMVSCVSILKKIYSYIMLLYNFVD